MTTIKRNLSVDLVNWYAINKRNLPWRNINDAYKIWISEVILQQTRVIQGRPYYDKFIELFPTVQDFANADEQTILRCWQGLGYYSRARNMHATAKLVVANFKGTFPDSYKNLISLKGVGPYTASAIASFSANENVAVLDGNVMRVLTRIYNIEKDISEEKTRRELQLLANELLPEGKSSDHNQAMMELGAMICTPKNPKCETCPVNSYCLALENNTVAFLPFKSKKVKVKSRYFNYIVMKDPENRYYMKKRGNKDIWSGLWDFLLIESAESIDSIQELKLNKELSSNLVFIKSGSELKHQLTHQTIWAKFWIFDLVSSNPTFLNENDLLPLDSEQIHATPKPILINNFLNRYIF